MWSRRGGAPVLPPLSSKPPYEDRSCPDGNCFASIQVKKKKRDVFFHDNKDHKTPSDECPDCGTVNGLENKDRRFGRGGGEGGADLVRMSGLSPCILR